MQVSLNMSSKHDNYYGVKLLFSLLLLLFILAFTSHYLIQNYYSKSFLNYNLNGKKIYFLKSDTVKNMHTVNGMDYEGYQKRVDHFKELALINGYESLDIQSDELKELDTNSKLIALDSMALSSDEIDNIDKFVTKGGRILFNFTSGFLDTSLKYKSDNLVKRVTTLELNQDINTIKYDQNSTGYLSTKLVSPLTKFLPEGKALDLAIYDPLPLFKTPKNLTPDAYITNWSQSNYIKISKNRELKKEESGLIWHGYKELGKWVYFSFPSYVFLETTTKNYSALFRGMIEYLDRDITAIPYPYIDSKNVVFVSEDTEYKYENLKQFSDVAKKHKFPVTAFCVANLAQKNRELMTEVSKNEFMEIGSHSYTHKKIVGESDAVHKRETIEAKSSLYELSGHRVTGFRPPREEIDQKIIELLQDGGFHYILAAGENRLSPYYNDEILIIPRHGTDDYSYLINLDWTSAQILEEMKHQLNVLVDLNAMYTMSTHTHLMTFSSNIKIVDDFFKYVNTQKHMKPMNGEMIYDRISKRDKISLSHNETIKKYIFTITNNNSEEVKDMHYELYLDPNISLGKIESEVIGVETELIKVTPSKYTLIIKSIKPKSKITLFLNYAKNI